MFKRSENVKTVVSDYLSRYDREQLPCLSLPKRLGSPAREYDGNILAPLEGQYYAIGLAKQV